MGEPPGHGVEVVPAGGADPLRERSLLRDLASRFFLWDAFVDGHRRVEACPLVLTSAAHGAAVQAAEGAARVVGRAAALAHDDADERALYRFEPETLRLAAASRAASDDASLMRVDLLLDERGAWRACEINADCPGGHNESFGLPRLARAAGFAAGRDPTRVVASLVERLVALASGGAVGVLHATGYAEDLQVCALVARELERRGARAVLAPPTAPTLRGETLCIQGEPVRALYRYFPTEWMSGQRNLESIARAVERGLVRTLTSFAHIFVQSKLSLARCHALAARGHLTREDREIVDRHVIETYDLLEIDERDLTARQDRWVVKRAMGRVGDEVFVGQLFDQAAWAAVVRDAYGLARGGESWVAQPFLRQRPVPTPWGERLVTLGAYVLDGRFAGYFARVTPRSHVAYDALCVPVFVR
ncbi:MAG TPA: glutathionylspermidine synthase family protein [Polyangiaceae bacterium]|nr:glutathionylspermidine synthase family protein [Polyangiaceae bacterium]